MITSGGIRLAGEYVFKQDRMSENWYVVHTQPRGEKMLKALLDREPAVADTYLPIRQQFAIVGGQRVSRMALTMPGLVFVRGNKNQLVALLREKSGTSRLMVDSSRKEKDAMVVADSEMTAFRLFNDNTAGQLMMLRSPFCNFTSADRIRIMSGPFAGYEGYIREIGGDNKLIFKVGSMAIALSNVMRYDVAVVENHHASTETSLQLRIADSLRARLEEAGHVDDACDRLRDIMTGAAGMPAAFTDADRAEARSLAQFCASDRKRIDSIVGNAPLRRFLTPTAETGTLRHSTFVEHRLPVALGDDRFTAHVAEHPDHSTAACWGEFATAICALAPSQRTALIDKLQRYGLTAFASAVEGSGQTRFEGAMLTSATLAPEALAAEGAAIIGEILASVRARRWRTLLYAVCLR